MGRFQDLLRFGGRLTRPGVATILVVAFSEYPLIAEDEIYGPPLLKRIGEERAERAEAPDPSTDSEVIDDSALVPEGAGATGASNLYGPRLLKRLPRFQGEANQSLTETGVGAPEAREHPILDRIWSWPVIYRNPDAWFLQEFSLFGRYHGQFYSVSSAQGSIDGWENRRSRIGARAIFLENFTAAASFNAKTDFGRGLSNVIDKENIDTLTLAWTPNDNFQAVIGQQKAGFSYEYDVSSNQMLTFERSLIVNQIVPDKSPGIAAEGKLEKLDYHLGFYSGNTIADAFDHGFALIKVGYDLSDRANVEKFGAQFYYMHTTEPLGTATSAYRNLYSFSADFQDGPYAGFVQTVFADGFGPVSDAWGLTVMPSRYLVEDKLQLVGRYQYAVSAQPNGLMAQNRYEQDVPMITNGGLGENYHAGYLGLNWYLYGQELKVMTGVEYSHLDGGGDGGDFDGWTWFGGLRLHF